MASNPRNPRSVAPTQFSESHQSTHSGRSGEADRTRGHQSPPTRHGSDPETRRRQRQGPSGPSGVSGPSGPVSWSQLAHHTSALAAQLHALVSAVPAGSPSEADAKALRRAVGELSTHTGILKRALGIGAPTPPPHRG